ncbi:hypothetical protein [Frankia tisae]|uniref:hypothetical protein n=1 Tax=Frankia tisae TaxID=2950104 RepID=UPI0021C21BF2|nr:hypothetical protein [Frankia tisae]
MTDVYPDSGSRGATGVRWRLGPLITSGGEGEIYEIDGRPSLVAKIYKDIYLAQEPGRRDRLERKLAAMIGKQPTDPLRANGHVSIAWPTTILRARRGGPLIGFAMPKAPDKARLLHKVFSPTDLREDGIAYDWRFQIGVGRNLAAVFEAMHAPGRYVIGDPNPNNFLVASDGLVTMVDCDSVQVDDGPGNLFLCEVAMEELLPPEFPTSKLATDRRQVSLDTWALALLLYRALMRDARPYSGWQGPQQPNVASLARQGQFNQMPATSLQPTRHTPPLTILPPRLREMFVECFTKGGTNPAKRPTAAQWHQQFDTLYNHLAPCRQDKHHFYSDHLAACPWCKLAATTGQRQAGTATQISLTPVNYPRRGGQRPGSGRTVTVPRTTQATGYPGPGYPGPGGPGAPGPAAAARRRRRRGFGAGIAVVMAIVIAIVSSHTSQSSPSISGSTSTGTGGGSSGGGTSSGGSSGGGSSSGGSTQLTFAQEAQGVDTILRNSGTSRKNLVDAINQVDTCGDLASAAQVIASAVTERNNQIAQANTLPLDQLSNGSTIRSELVTFLESSRQTDQYYQTWAQNIAQGQQNTGQCPGTNSHNDPAYQSALSGNQPASEAKQAFLNDWNPDARQAYLPTYQEQEI